MRRYLTLLSAMWMLPGILASEPGRQFEVSAVFECPVDEAWYLWTTNEGIRAGIGVQGSDIELKLGGKFEIYFGMTFPVGQRGSEECKVLSYHPREMLAFSWNAPPSLPELRNAGVRTQVVVRFTKKSDAQTLVTLTHLGIGQGENWDKYEQYFKRAWPSVLKHMQDHVAKADRSTKGIKVTVPLEPLLHEGVVEASVAEVWKAFTTKEGLESWMVRQASFDLKVDGKMLTTYNKDARLGDEHTIENTIRAYVPERMLSIQCTKTPKGFPFTKSFAQVWSVCYFEPISDKQTRVRFVGLNYGTDEESQKLRKFFEAGNAQVLASLQKKFGK